MRAVRTLAAMFLLLALKGGSAHAETPESLVTLRASHEGELERGRAATLSLVVQAGASLSLLPTAPLILELEGTALDPAHRTLRRRDAIDPRAEAPRFEIDIKPHRDGTPSLTAHLTAWVCRGRRCRPVEQRLPIVLSIARPPQP